MIRKCAIFCLVGFFSLVGCGFEGDAPRPLAKTASLEVYAVTPAGTPGALTLPKAPGASQAAAPSIQQVTVSAKPIISSEDVETIQRSTVGEEFPSITVNLTPAGAARMTAATSAMAGSSVAFVVNGTVVSTPKVLTAISGSFRVTGDGTAADHDELFRSLTDE